MLASFRWGLAALAAVSLVAVALVVVVTREGKTTHEEIDLEAALAFLDVAIAVDIRPAEGDVVYSRIESYSRARLQVAPVRETWLRLGSGARIVETLSREREEDGSLRRERHSTREREARWRKEEAVRVRSALVEGSARVVELTDDSLTAEWRFRRDDWSVPHARGIEDPVEEILRLIIDDRGRSAGRDILVLTAAGEEVLAMSDRVTIRIRDEMPAPASP